MIETRAAILALMLLSLLVFQFKSNVGRERMDMIHGEVQMVASGIAVEHLDAVGVMDFDDIPNLQGTQRTADVALEDDTLSFDLASSVRYVVRDGDTFVPASSATNYLEVAVTVDGLLDSSVRMSRIYRRAAN